MNRHGSKRSVPPSVGADVSRIETLLKRNLPEFSVKVIRLAEGPQFRNFTLKTVYCACRPTLSSVTMLDKFAGDLRATHPHFVYMHHGEPQVLHNSGRLAWGSGP